MKTFLATLATVTLIAAAAQAAVQPWTMINGTVGAVDRDAGTVTVGGQTYTAAKMDLQLLQPGQEIDIWVNGTKAEALAIVAPNTDVEQPAA